MFIRRQQHNARALGLQIAVARPMIRVAEVNRECAADDRLDAIARELLGEFQRPEHVVGVGERKRRLSVGLRQLGKARNRQRAFQQRIGRVHVQVHEIEAGHVCSKVG